MCVCNGQSPHELLLLLIMIDSLSTLSPDEDRQYSDPIVPINTNATQSWDKLLTLIYLFDTRWLTPFKTFHEVIQTASHDLLPSGLAAQFVEQRFIKSEGRWFYSIKSACSPFPCKTFIVYGFTFDCRALVAQSIDQRFISFGSRGFNSRRGCIF